MRAYSLSSLQISIAGMRIVDHRYRCYRIRPIDPRPGPQARGSTASSGRVLSGHEIVEQQHRLRVRHCQACVPYQHNIRDYTGCPAATLEITQAILCFLQESGHADIDRGPPPPVIIAQDTSRKVGQGWQVPPKGYIPIWR
jgi:hypothetical protein